MKVVYKIISKTTGKFYIGSTINYRERKTRHLRELRNKKHHCLNLQALYDEKGEEDLDFEILEELSCKKELLEKEQFYIDTSDKNLLLNIMWSSTCGDTLSNHPLREERIKRITASVIERYSNMSVEERKQKHGRSGEENPNWRGGTSVKFCTCGKQISPTNTTCMKCKDIRGVKNPFYGKKHSQETIEKIRNKNKGVIPPCAIKVEVKGVVYRSLVEAGRAVGVCAATVRNRCKRGVEGYKLIKA